MISQTNITQILSKMINLNKIKIRTEKKELNKLRNNKIN
jgi:hypothetical protein